MIYFAALAALLSMSLLKRATQPFAWVFVLVWMATWAFEMAGLPPQFMPAVDIVAFNTLSVMYLARRSWWSLALTVIGLATVICHFAAWATYGMGLYLGDVYFHTLRALFFLSALVLACGGYDVFQRLASSWVSLRNPSRLHARSLGLGYRHPASPPPEEKQ